MRDGFSAPGAGVSQERWDEIFSNRSKNKVVGFELMKAGVPTVNGRIYPKEILQLAVQEYQAKIKERLAFGWLVPSQKLSEVSHLITKLEFDDERQQLVGDFEILPTPQGKLLAEMLADCNAAIKFSPNPSGEGTVDENGTVTEYKFISVGVSPSEDGDSNMCFNAKK
jgi:hypothetical protein